MSSSFRSEVEVLGPLRGIRFPGYCLKCGRETNRTMRLSKLFRRTGRRNGSRHVYYVPGDVDAPFCEPCISTHRRERPPLGRDVRKRLLLAWLLQSLVFAFPLGASLWFLRILLPEVKEALGGEPQPIEILVAAGLVGFFVLTSLSFLFLIFSRGRKLRIEPNDTCFVQIESGPLGSRFTAPVEPSSVSGALDFSDDLSEPFDAERHRYSFRNDGVAAEFAQLNADRTWNPASPRARVAAGLRWTLVIAILLFGLYQMVKDALR